MWDIYFYISLGIKWHMQTGGNVVLSGRQNVPAEHVIKVVAAVMDYALWHFSNGVNKLMDFDTDVGKDNEIFSAH